MAIALPDAEAVVRRGSPIAPIACPSRLELGYSEIEVAELLGLSRETVSRWWTASTSRCMAWKLSQATAPAARSAPVVPSTTGQAARLRTTSNEKSPEGGGDRLPVVDPRAVAELSARSTGSTCRCGPSASVLSSGGATLPKVPPPSCARSPRTPRRVRHWLEVTYPAIEARAAREDAGVPLVRQHWPAADQHRDGVTGPEGGRRGSRCPTPHPHEPDLYATWQTRDRSTS